MSIISGKTIQSLVLIHPLTPKNLRAASYDLAVGNEFFICNNKNKTESHTVAASVLNDQQSMEIPANAVCYIISREKISLPNNISARVSLRMTLIYEGLLLAAQPPFDPGYDGFVVAMLYNLSDRSIFLREGDRFLTIEFFNVDGQTMEFPKSKNVRFLDQSLKRHFRSNMDSLSIEFKALQQQCNKEMDRHQDIVKRILTIAGIIFTFASLFSYQLYNKQSDEISNQANIIESLREQQQHLMISLERVKSDIVNQNTVISESPRLQQND